MPIDYKQYPSNWKEIRQRILARAGNKCETCGVPNGVEIMRCSDGTWKLASDALDDLDRMPYEAFCALWGDTQTPTRIILTISHQDHDITHNSDDNLKALCQKCHLSYDAQHHAESRRRNRDKKFGQGKLIDTDV